VSIASFGTNVRRLYMSNPLTRRLFYRLRYAAVGRCLVHWHGIPGWTTREEAAALGRASYSLPADAIVVEVGSFLGKSTVVLAGARKLRGSGKVHCVDPFDGSGDKFSVPFYSAIASETPLTLRERFEASMRYAGLTGWVVVHQGTAEAISSGWTQPIDMLFLDGDQTPQGARSAYERFVPFLKRGGVVALHNSSEREYAVGHDGYRRLVIEEFHAPVYSDIYCVESTTFAQKAG